MKSSATVNLASVWPMKNCPYSQFSLYAVAGTEMIVTALISVARKDRHAAHHGMRRRARKKSLVPLCSRLNTQPMAISPRSETTRMV